MVNQMLYMTLIINWQHIGKCKIWCCYQFDICNDEMETLGVEPQKDHILFIISHTIYQLILLYPSIKPLTFTTFIINMGLYYHFLNHLFLSILSEFMVNY